MLTPEEGALPQHYVYIDAGGNIVGNDNAVRVIKQAAGDYTIQTSEQYITFNITELRRVLHIEHSQVGIVGDHARVEGSLHQHKHYHYDAAPPKPEGRYDYYRHIPLPHTTSRAQRRWR